MNNRPSVPPALNPLDFFVAGGTLRHDAPSYVRRPADEELYRAARDGRFCYVLTPRQMGKSSLMVRTARRLQADGVRTAVIDLTGIGTEASAGEWYLAIIMRLRDQLRLRLDARAWWQEQSGLGPVQRFSRFLTEVVLTANDRPAVIFIDEIDTTLSLPFSDDFFAAIRALHNERASDDTFCRLTFVFLGVAHPADLIKDPLRTPFNVGQAIDLQEFSRADARVLEQGLATTFPGQGEAMFGRIYWWTNGHPYLTQRLCLGAIEHQDRIRQVRQVDEVVRLMFLTDAARGETNIQFVSNRILLHPQCQQLLKLYRRVWEGETVAEEKQSTLQSQLKLTGLVRADNGGLRLRNRIYREAFDRAWIQEHTAVNYHARLLVTAALLVLLLVTAVLLHDSLLLPQRAAAAEVSFRQASAPPTQAAALVTLFDLDPVLGEGVAYAGTAYDLLYALSPPQQMALFAAGSAADLTRLAEQIYPTLADVDGQDNTRPLLQTMAQSLAAYPEDAVAVRLKAEIEQWLLARSLAAAGDWNGALVGYNTAVTMNPSNPALYYERARVKMALNDYPAAAADLEQVLASAPENIAVTAALVRPTPTPLPNLTPATAVPPTPTILLPSTPPQAGTPAASPPTTVPEAPVTAITPAAPLRFASRGQRIDAVGALIAAAPAFADYLATTPANAWPGLRRAGLVPARTSNVLWLDFETGGEERAFPDRSGYGLDGRCTPGSCPLAVPNTAVPGTAAQFDGLDDVIHLADPEALDILGSITLVAWVQPQATGGFRNIIARGFSLEPAMGEVFLRINEGVYEAGSWQGGDGRDELTHLTRFPMPAIDNGRWVHLAGVYDGASWRLYRDGVEVSATADIVGAVPVAEGWAIGAQGDGDGRFFQGGIDEVRIYGRALTAAEIAALARP